MILFLHYPFQRHKKLQTSSKQGQKVKGLDRNRKIENPLAGFFFFIRL